MKIPNQKYPELYQWITEFQEKTKFKRKIKLIYTNDKGGLGRVTALGNIKLQKKFIECFMDSQPNVVKFILAHEFIHLIQEELFSLYRVLLPKCYKPVVLLQELRANINGAALAGLLNEEFRETQILLWIYEGNMRKQLTYECGYPSRIQNIKFACKYNRYNDEAGYELINDYYAVSSGPMNSVGPTKSF
ncbi:hypothetical protein [Paenibacillus sp. sgz500958]|uniref:hypothetical protein n=1 Tax=Paenibacillus sp. sgz500958 TaxID=3242475 RepID=UPI0036D2E72C